MRLNRLTTCSKLCKIYILIFLTINLSQLSLSASSTLRKLNAAQRKCFFIDESSGDLEIYSFNICQMMCRAKAALAVCGCRPY